jgi:hypothetical protein
MCVPSVAGGQKAEEHTMVAVDDVGKWEWEEEMGWLVTKMGPKCEMPPAADCPRLWPTVPWPSFVGWKESWGGSWGGKRKDGWLMRQPPVADDVSPAFWPVALRATFARHQPLLVQQESKWVWSNSSNF